MKRKIQLDMKNGKTYEVYTLTDGLYENFLQTVRNGDTLIIEGKDGSQTTIKTTNIEQYTTITLK